MVSAGSNNFNSCPFTLTGVALVDNFLLVESSYCKIKYYKLQKNAQFLSHNCVILKIYYSTLYVPCIVTNSTNKPTRCTFCMYLFYNLLVTLHVSKDYFVHHQVFINLLYLQLCTNHANVPNCSVLRLELCCVAIATQYKPCKRA